MVSCPRSKRTTSLKSELTWFVTEEQLKAHNEKVHEKVHVCPYEGCDFKTKGRNQRTAFGPVSRPDSWRFQDRSIVVRWSLKRFEFKELFDKSYSKLPHRKNASNIAYLFRVSGFVGQSAVGEINNGTPFIFSVSKEKKFKCDFCDYRASCMGHIDRHMVVHTGLKPFKCQWCDYRSNQKQNTKNHEKLYCKYRIKDNNDQ